MGFIAPFMNQAGALVHLYMDGSYLVTSAAIEMGQGVFTKLACVRPWQQQRAQQLTAEQLVGTVRWDKDERSCQIAAVLPSTFCRALCSAAFKLAACRWSPSTWRYLWSASTSQRQPQTRQAAQKASSQPALQPAEFAFSCKMWPGKSPTTAAAETGSEPSACALPCCPQDLSVQGQSCVSCSARPWSAGAQVPNTSPSAASSTSDLNCGAVEDACGQLKQRLLPFLKGGSVSFQEAVKVGCTDYSCPGGCSCPAAFGVSCLPRRTQCRFCRALRCS